MPAVRLDAMTVVRVPGARVALSTSSVYPQNCATAFDIAERLGYDGVEVMVWTDPVSQEAGALKALSDLHAMPVVSIHAPTLLLTQRVWGPEAWPKVDNSIELATALGADTVVLHPPFRWQKEYARTFTDGVALREDESGIRLAVENMFPWRAGTRSLEALAVQGFSGSVVVEVSTRRVSEEQREADLAESLAFARLHLAAAAVPR